MGLILLKIGLVIIPFYELLAKLLPYGHVMTPDTRFAKSFIGLWLALIIGLVALYNGQMKKCRNLWLFLFILYIPVSITLAPKFPIVVNEVASMNFWVWRPFLTFLAYFLMFLAVQSMPIRKEDFDGIVRVMVWTGLAMSVYAILQAFGYDQFFDVRTEREFWQVTRPEMVGNLGNSTILAPYIAMLVPFALYLRKWVVAGILVSTVILTASIVGIIALCASLAVYTILRFKKNGLIVCCMVLSLLIPITVWYATYHPVEFAKATDIQEQSNGRITQWQNILDAVKNGRYSEDQTRHPFTGVGPGSFGVIIQQKINSHFRQAHNEYLEILATLGIFGIVFIIGAHVQMARLVREGYSENENGQQLSALISSFLCIGLCAAGTFVYQLAPHNFYTVAVIGLLHNQSILKGEK